MRRRKSDAEHQPLPFILSALAFLCQNTAQRPVSEHKGHFCHARIPRHRRSGFVEGAGTTRWLRVAMTLAGMLVIAGTIGLSRQALGASAGPPPVIRTLTWNTWLLPDLVTGTTLGGMNNDDRIHHIAARLNTEKYDVVALNEVWINIEDPISDPTETNSDFIYLLTHDIPNPGASSAADLFDRYSKLSALPGEKPKGATGQYPYYAWVPAFYHDLLKVRGDAGLMVLTQFPPLPRKLPAGVKTWHLSYMSVDNPTNFFCFGKGQQEFEADVAITFAPWPTPPYPPGLPADAYTDDLYLMDELRSPTLVWSSPGFETWTDDECAGAYAWFKHKGGDDALSSKGVGWVRVRNTKTNRPLNIFFTHTQGDYVSVASAEEYVAERRKQMEVIRSFIQKMAPEREDILLMGDLNILADSQWLAAETVPTAAMKAEYDAEIGGFLAGMGFEDTFREQLRPTDKDFGWTRDYAKNDNNGQDDYKQRLDYILAKWHANPSSWLNTSYCVQHVRVRRDFDSLHDAEDSFQVDADISDHWPVEMTWGIDKGFCSPVKAFDLASIPPNQAYAETTLQYGQPGALQWLRIPANADVVITADLATGGPNTSTVLMHPFKATDISMPLEQFAGPNEQGAGGVRDLNNGLVLSYPFDVYVRVMATQTAFTGSGKIRITRLDGTSFEKAVPIAMTGYPTSPKSEVSYGGRWNASWSRMFTMAAKQFAQPAQQFIWFRFNAEVRSTAAPHCVTINLMQEHMLLSPQYTSPPMPAPRSYKFALYNAQGVALQPFSAPVSTGGAGDVTPFVLSWSCGAHPKLKFSAPAENLRIMVNRGVASDAADPFRLNITTDKRGVRFKKLDVLMEDDGASTEDEPVAIHDVDGPNYRLMAWGIDTGGAVTNWNHVFDAYPAGMSYKDVQFSTRTKWKLGESNACNGCWDGSATDWFYETYNGTAYWHQVDYGPGGVSSSSMDYGFSWSFTTTQNEKTLSFDRAIEWVPDAGHYRLYYQVYMPGGRNMEAAE